MADTRNEQKIPANYAGMCIEELPYLYAENQDGVTTVFRLDILTRDPDVPAAENAVGTDDLRPAVIFLHGGGYVCRCDKRQGYVATFSRALTRMGCVVFAPDYPTFATAELRDAAGGRAAGYLKAAAAVHALYGWIAAHAEEYKVDPTRIAIMGGSAGGWTAFHAVADYPQDKYRFLGNCWGTPDEQVDVSHFPPTLSIHGTADQAVSYDLEAPLQAALEQYGIPHDLVTLEGSKHTPVGRFAEFLPLIEKYVTEYMR